MTFPTPQPPRSNFPHYHFAILLAVAVSSIFFTIWATAGTLNPSAAPGSTMKTLQEIYNSIAATDFDSSSITGDQNGSVIEGLKYINNNLGWASSSNNIYSLSSGNVGIGDSTPTFKLDVAGSINASSSYRLNASTILRAPGTDNLLIGHGAGGASISSGFGNTMLGKDAGRDLTTGAVNVYIGWQAGRLASAANHNVFVGANAGANNTSGSTNVFIGRQSGVNNTTGANNVFIGGFNAGSGNTTGFGNIFMGDRAGAQNTTGVDNIAIGFQAGQGMTQGTGNTLIGKFAGNSASVKTLNTMVGYEAGRSAGGNYQTFLGTGAGHTTLGGAANTGGFNIFIGPGTSGSVATITSSIGIGYGALVTASHQAVIGSNIASGSITDVYLGQGVATVSAQGVTINATGGSGTNNPGAPLRLAGGKATGNAAGGSILFQTSDVGSSGSTLQSLTTKMTLTASGSLGIGTTAPFVLFNKYGPTYKALSILGPDTTGTFSTGILELATQVPDSSDYEVGWLEFASINNSTDREMAAIGARASGSSANNRGADLEFWTKPNGGSTTKRMVITNNGNVGIGTASPMALSTAGTFTNLNISNTSAAGHGKLTLSSPGTSSGLRVGSIAFGPSGSSASDRRSAYITSDLSASSATAVFGDLLFFTNNGGSVTERVRILANGNVGIGSAAPTSKLQIVGGNCADDAGGGGCTADYAEYYPASEDMEKGDLVVADTSSSSYAVRKSRGSSALLGVVSSAPAAIADGGSLQLMNNQYVLDPRKPAVALVGRVPLKVSLENGPIQVGDRLTASSVPGIAMKATQPGMTVGIALEPLPSITSGSYEKVLTFVNVGYWMPEGMPSTAHSLSGIDSESIFERLTDRLASAYNLIIRDGMIQALEGVFKRVKTEELEMKDSVTGEMFCVRIANGEWVKEKRTCH